MTDAITSPTVGRLFLREAEFVGGQVIGATDADGIEVVDRPVSVPDLFASLCFSLGIDDTDQNYSRGGRPIRVVNDGSVIKELFA